MNRTVTITMSMFEFTMTYDAALAAAHPRRYRFTVREMLELVFVGVKGQVKYYDLKREDGTVISPDDEFWSLAQDGDKFRVELSTDLKRGVWNKLINRTRPH